MELWCCRYRVILVQMFLLLVIVAAALAVCSALLLWCLLLLMPLLQCQQLHIVILHLELLLWAELLAAAGGSLAVVPAVAIFTAMWSILSYILVCKVFSKLPSTDCFLLLLLLWAVVVVLCCDGSRGPSQVLCVDVLAVVFCSSCCCCFCCFCWPRCAWCGCACAMSACANLMCSLRSMLDVQLRNGIKMSNTKVNLDDDNDRRGEPKILRGSETMRRPNQKWCNVDEIMIWVLKVLQGPWSPSSFDLSHVRPWGDSWFLTHSLENTMNGDLALRPHLTMMRWWAWQWAALTLSSLNQSWPQWGWSMPEWFLEHLTVVNLKEWAWLWALDCWAPQLLMLMLITWCWSPLTWPWGLMLAEHWNLMVNWSALVTVMPSDQDLRNEVMWWAPQWRMTAWPWTPWLSAWAPSHDQVKFEKNTVTKWGRGLRMSAWTPFIESCCPVTDDAAEWWADISIWYWYWFIVKNMRWHELWWASWGAQQRCEGSEELKLIHEGWQPEMTRCMTLEV